MQMRYCIKVLWCKGSPGRACYDLQTSLRLVDAGKAQNGGFSYLLEAIAGAWSGPFGPFYERHPGRLSQGNW